MNKNTIVKLIAVLAMCFLIGGALVACKGAAGPAGPQGPQGEKGETGAAGSTPVLTIGANGNWFADGVDLGVKAPSADAACTEHDFAFIDVVKHTQTEDGVVVKACKSCGYAAITNETLHVMEAGEIPANCLEAKWVGEFCSVCNFKGEGEFVGAPNGHNYTKAQPVTHIATEGYICVNGGMLVQHCKACKDVQYTTVEAGEYPHTIYNWTLSSKPSETQFGFAYGTCTICPNSETLPLPLIGEWTKDEITAVTCGTDGEYKYTYEIADRNLKLDFKQVEPATGHKLNGKNYAEYDVDADKTNGYIIPLYYGVADADGRLPALNVKPFAGDKFDCTESQPQAGYFYCEECKDVVNVSVNVDHNGKTEIVTQPTCCTVGAKKVKCDNANCTHDDFANNTTSVVAKLPHAYLYELVADGKYTDAKGNEYDNYNLVGTCKGNGIAACTDSATITLHEDIYNVKVDPISEPNCLEYGQIKYTFNKQGQDNILTETLLVPKTNHVLNGEVLESYTGMFTNTPGIKEFSNAEDKFSNFTCEDTDVPAYFVCEFCKVAAPDDAIVAVEVTKAHKEFEVTIAPAATCTTTGTKTFKCSDEKCSQAAGYEFTVTLEMIPHAYEYVIEDFCKDMDEVATEAFIATNGYRYQVTNVCKVCGAADPDFGTKQYKKLNVIADVKATCYSEGYTIYSVELSAGTASKLEVKHSVRPHTLAGYEFGSAMFDELYMISATQIKSTTPGVKAFANKALACGESVDGYYVCEVCAAAGLEGIVNLGTVQIYKDHAIKSIDTPATCMNPGTAICADCKTNGNDTKFQIPAIGHDYDLKYEVKDDKVGITGKCKRNDCNESVADYTKTWSFDVPTYTLNEDFIANGNDVYAKPVLVEDATCLTGAKYTLTVNFDKDGNAIKLDDLKGAIVFITVSFEDETAALDHDYEKAVELIVEKEVVNADEEVELYYYFVSVCNRCGNYKCTKVLNAADYADYLEDLANKA